MIAGSVKVKLLRPFVGVKEISRQSRCGATTHETARRRSVTDDYTLGSVVYLVQYMGIAVHNPRFLWIEAAIAKTLPLRAFMLGMPGAVPRDRPVRVHHSVYVRERSVARSSYLLRLTRLAPRHGTLTRKRPRCDRRRGIPARRSYHLGAFCAARGCCAKPATSWRS